MDYSMAPDYGPPAETGRTGTMCKPRLCSGVGGHMHQDGTIFALYARVAELVDALDLGSSGRFPVGVRVPSFAPFLK